MALTGNRIKYAIPHCPVLAVILAMLVTGLLLPDTVLAGTQATINLSTKAKVDGESVTLGRIATIETPDAALRDKLSAVVVSPAPLPGDTLYVNPQQVELGLKKDRFDVKSLNITASGPVKVTRSHTTVSPERIKTEVTAFIKNHVPWSQDQVTIRPINYVQSHIVPPGRVKLALYAPRHTDWLGGVPVTVKILVNGQTVKKITVSTYIDVWQNVILTAKPIGRNQPITNSDIKLKKMNLTRVPANAILHTDQVVGRRANRSIAINSVLRSDQIDTPALVRRGDLVQVLVETKSVRVSTKAVAKEDGKLGERIRLVNSRSKKVLYGSVVDPQTVRVEF